jgi:UDP-N-acetyl-D-mannosaminuronic acid dehydrogenase
MVTLLENELTKIGKKIEGAKIGVLGIAMKDYSNDDRISPPIEIIKILKARGAEVFAYDPAVPTKYDFKIASIEEALVNKDGVMILAKQSEFDNVDIEYLINKLNKETIVFDTKNLFKKFREELQGNSILYKSI